MVDLKQEIIESLKNVYDPEIPINVYDLGLIYDIKINSDNNVNILMTLTSPTCPTAEFIKDMISDAVSLVSGVKGVEIELTFEPMWTPDKITKEAREELGFEEDKTLNVGVERVFENNSNTLRICFNCGISEDKKPIVEGFYKLEKVNICVSCFNKF